MGEEKYTISQKQKMLGAALYARRVSRENAVAILMALEDDDQVDDMTWYMGQNPQDTQEQLVAVAYQIAKDAREGK